MENEKKKGIFGRFYDWLKNLTVKGLLLAIFIAFVIIIILLSASYLPSIISRASSSISAALYSIFVPAENATMTADKKILASGEDFTVNFKRGDTDPSGIFTIFYECDQSINLFAIEGAGTKGIDCNKSYYLLDNPTSLKIRAVTRDEEVVRLTITGALENSENQKSETVGVVRLTVTNAATGVTINETEPTKATSTTSTGSSVNLPSRPITPSPVTPTYYGRADLAVRVLQVGILNTATNQIVSQQSQFNSSDTVGIRFEIRNGGTNSTGNWNFNVALPSMTNPSFASQIQRSLAPGESIQYTLGFNNLNNQYSNQIAINADPAGGVSESNEGNNLATATVYNTNYNSNTNYNNNYNNYNYSGSSGLYAYCYADPINPETGDRVRWYVSLMGGNGNYDFDWSGTNGLDSSSQNPTKTYSSEGTKYATVRVSSGGQTITQTCSVYVDDDNNNNNSDRDDAREAINDAQDAIDEADEEIDDSNSSNSRKDDARDILEEAEDRLDDAEEAYDDEDYDEAEDLANEAEDLADDAVDEL